ncbi:ribokinase [Agromyces protaetiae]|uniref:Ribokinase n=2 Tax=Agromyces protaetiae TaxID=2509455 RepID=A0A4P6FFA1_9MICO|nr:ribokinase [Agromyces protaetiae]
MDLVFTGLAAMPVPGETVAARSFELQPGGKGANQASAAAALGADVRLVAALGDDEFGRIAAADLRARGVSLDHVATVPGPSGVAGVLIDQAGENVVIVNPGANGALDGADASAVADRIGAESGALTVLASLEVPLDAIRAWARVARERGWRFILNPAPAPAEPLDDELLALVDVITPNQTELASIGEERLAAVVPVVVVTLGGDGAEVRAGGTVTRVPAFAVEPVDTTGAGDAFNGALAVGLASGRQIGDAVRLACAVGALATRGLGARSSLPDAAEAEAFAG